MIWPAAAIGQETCRFGRAGVDVGAPAIMRAMTTVSSVAADPNALAIVRCILESFSDGWIVLGLPGTAYRLRLRPTVPVEAITTSGGAVGKRIKGTIHAKALRMFKASGGGGGQFIEPLDGEPRIVAGRVIHVDQPNRRVLVDMAAPVWMTLADGQATDMFVPGDMVNCYVQSGTLFTSA